ncbi:MAG: hypothetical protein ACJ8AI_34305 [Rhodopila sp.]
MQDPSHADQSKHAAVRLCAKAGRRPTVSATEPIKAKIDHLVKFHLRCRYDSLSALGVGT